MESDQSQSLVLAEPDLIVLDRDWIDQLNTKPNHSNYFLPIMIGYIVIIFIVILSRLIFSGPKKDQENSKDQDKIAPVLEPKLPSTDPDLQALDYMMAARDEARKTDPGKDPETSSGSNNLLYDNRLNGTPITPTPQPTETKSKQYKYVNPKTGEQVTPEQLDKMGDKVRVEYL